MYKLIIQNVKYEQSFVKNFLMVRSAVYYIKLNKYIYYNKNNFLNFSDKKTNILVKFDKNIK